MRHSRRLRTAPGSLVGVVVEHLRENSRHFLSPFSQNFIFLCGCGGRGVGVLYTMCLNAPVSRVARKFRVSRASCVSIFVHDSYLCMLMQRVGCIA